MPNLDTNTSCIVKSAAYRDGRRIANVELCDVSEVLKQTDRFVWIGLHEPTEEVLLQVQEEFGLHELAIEDAHRAHQRPKLETYGDTLFIVLRTAQINAQQQHHIDFGETHFFVGSNFIVSVRHGSSLAYTEVRTRCESKPHLLRKGPSFALYALMDSIVDQYFPVVDGLEQQLEKIEEQIFSREPSRDTTAQIYQLKRELLEVKRAISPLIDICNRLVRFDFDLIPEDTRTYFRDIYDHVLRINEIVDNTREMLSTALEANFSLLSISQSEVGKRFAGWAAIVGVPTLIAGIYGMNFHHMPGQDWDYGFEAILALTIGSCLALFILFRRAGWL
ncbi:MAG: magnesium/cobalt transporter CorA [Phycisphaerae bacterium]|nr:magnesium/cobalt transporter CorA [Saprospiraceae bacterium]